MSRATTPFARLGLLAALTALTVAGAGAATAAPVVIEFKDGVITPQVVEIAAGEPAELLIRNTGTSAGEFESKALKKETVIGPGKEMTVKLPALPAGDYAFVDEFHERQESAKGTVRVK